MGTVDKVAQIKFLKGYWINGDYRRSVIAVPDGIMASNFGGTTIGPGAYDWTKTIKHFWDVPMDWLQMEDGGMTGVIPIHNHGEPTEDTPAYFIDARHATSTGMAIHGMSVLLNEKCAQDGRYKHWLVNHVAPPGALRRRCAEGMGALRADVQRKGHDLAGRSVRPIPVHLRMGRGATRETRRGATIKD